MPIELAILAWASLFGIAQLFITAAVRTRAYGTGWNVGARDTTPIERATPLVGRLERAQANLMETFPLFAAVVLAVAIADRTNASTTMGAWLYLAGRLVYLPLYVAGVPFVRTLAWGVATTGILLIARPLLG